MRATRPDNLKPSNLLKRAPAGASVGRRRRGSILVYSFFLLVIMLAMTSLAMDYGRVQAIKTQAQRDADVTARGCLQMYVSDGASTAYAIGPIMANNSYNPVDANSGIAPTVTITWGYWNAGTNAFTAGSGSPMAVKVVVSRTSVAGNAVPLTFPLVNGSLAVKTSCDVTATAIAVLDATTTTSSTVSAKSDIWLSGMPGGSNAGWTDTPANAPSTLVLDVTPGTVLTFSGAGQTHYNGTTVDTGPEGMSYSTTHMAGSPDGNYNGVQNGIQTLKAPQNALVGVFLTGAAPNTVTTPSTSLDYAAAAARDQTAYRSLLVQQPFFVGDGQTTSGVTQSFVVPLGATRLYLGVFDGWQNNDNPGSISVTTIRKMRVHLVK